MLRFSILLRFLAVIFVLFFHLGHIPLSPHFVLLCFCMLKSATCPALENNGLMKKRFFRALQFSVPCSPELGTSGVSPMCCMHPADVSWPLFSFSPVALFACCGQCLFSVVLVTSLGLPWAWVKSDQAFARDAVTPKCRVLWLPVPWNTLIGGPSQQSDQLSASSPLLCLLFDSCLWFSFPLPRVGVTLEWCWPLLFVAPIWMDSDKEPIGGTDPQYAWGSEGTVVLAS